MPPLAKTGTCRMAEICHMSTGMLHFAINNSGPWYPHADIVACNSTLEKLLAFPDYALIV